MKVCNRLEKALLNATGLPLDGRQPEGLHLEPQALILAAQIRQTGVRLCEGLNGGSQSGLRFRRSTVSTNNRHRVRSRTIGGGKNHPILTPQTAGHGRKCGHRNDQG